MTNPYPIDVEKLLADQFAAASPYLFSSARLDGPFANVLKSSDSQQDTEGLLLIVITPIRRPGPSRICRRGGG
jgi:hypothetical protein